MQESFWTPSTGLSWYEGRSREDRCRRPTRTAKAAGCRWARTRAGVGRTRTGPGARCTAATATPTGGSPCRTSRWSRCRTASARRCARCAFRHHWAGSSRAGSRSSRGGRTPERRSGGSESGLVVHEPLENLPGVSGEVRERDPDASHASPLGVLDAHDLGGDVDAAAVLELEVQLEGLVVGDLAEGLEERAADADVRDAKGLPGTVGEG